MTLTEQVYAQAALLAGALDDRQKKLLEILCASAVSVLTGRMREGLTPDDCRADFVAAASLFALAALNQIQEEGMVEEFRAGEIAVRKKGKDAASRVLQNQAELVIAPYLRDRFVFLGV